MENCEVNIRFEFRKREIVYCPIVQCKRRTSWMSKKKLSTLIFHQNLETPALDPAFRTIKEGL